MLLFSGLAEVSAIFEGSYENVKQNEEKRIDPLGTRDVPRHAAAVGAGDRRQVEVYEAGGIRTATGSYH